MSSMPRERTSAVEEAPHASFRCRVCESGDLDFYYAQGSRGQFRYYKCPRCGLVNLDLANGLDQEQYTEELADPRDDGVRQHREIDASFEFIRRYVAGPARLLDIGCGNGRLLYVAQGAGWQVKGVELSPRAAKLVEQRVGVPVAAEDFLVAQSAEADLGAYDVVCLRHVLEHMPDPKLAMSRIRALLKPNGYALLEMPNIESFEKRVKRWINRHGLHKRRFAEDFVAGHCNEYCHGSFEYLAGIAGFRVLRWETYSKKALTTFLYRLAPIGNNARALVQRIDTVKLASGAARGR